MGNDILKKKKSAQINLKKYARFQRKFPWQLIIRSIVAFAIIVLFYFGLKWLSHNSPKVEKNSREGIEVEIDS